MQNRVNVRHRFALTRWLALSLTLLVAASCGSSNNASTYDFTAAASVALGLKSRSLPTKSLPSLTESWSTGFLLPQREPLRTGPTLCTSTVCFTPTTLTGKYYGMGFLIQAGGNGMTAYFGQSHWSDITGTSTSYDFDVANPITNSGNLTCCSGTGDLSSSNTYISDVIYLFGYLDATFTVSGVTGNMSMNRAFTVRFVLADGAISGGLRGDVLLKDPAGGATFYWIDTATSTGGNVGAGTLVTTRPATPVVMNTSVVNWTNPFGTNQGNQTIPVIYAGVLPDSGSGVVTTSQSELAQTGKTYTYNFDPTNFVMFPTLQTADINMLSSYTELLSRIHLGGLPHASQPNGVGSPASTELVITSP
jgi:hypothetical protein